MDIANHLKELDRINQEMYQLQKLREKHLKDLTDLCPVEIGDIVKVNGYAYEGQDMKVERIKAQKGSYSIGNPKGYQWVLDGRVIKKDKTPGQNWAKAWIKIT